MDMPFTKRATETIGLVRRALREPEDAAETAAESGARYRIDREPEPGVGLQLTELDHDGKPTPHCVAHVTDPKTGSSLYPEAFPHLPGHDTFVSRDQEFHTVVWTRPSACQIPNVSPEHMEFLRSPAMQQLSAKLKPLAARARAGDATAKPEIKAALQDLRDNHPDVVRRLGEIWAGAFNDPATVAQHEGHLRELVRQSRDTGWRVLEETRQEAPSREILVTLEMGSRTRRLGLVQLGMLQLLVLEEPATA